MRTYHKDGTLPQNGEVFVFGSNLAGIHGAGAAKIAHEKFGAKWGSGSGPYSDKKLTCFAIPTKDHFIKTLSIEDIADEIKGFVTYTQLYPEYKYFVTRVGCGLAGYKDEEIAPMFKDAVNCSFAEEWRPYLESIKND